jgi:hypothetical protein
MIPKGIWFDHASVGSSPSITPATHATLGTGAFPMHTGQTDAEFASATTWSARVRSDRCC